LLDVEERRLCNGGDIVPLAPKAFDVLVTLVRRAGTLVTKRELLDLVWRDVAVEEGVLSVYVSAIRKSLGESVGHTGYIETVPRAGYRFSGGVTHHEAPAEPLEPLASAIFATALDESSIRDATRPLAAYELVGRGRAHLLSGSFFELPHAVSTFQAASDLDPTYAAAYAGLALALCAQAIARAVPQRKAFAEAKGAALRALAMDPECADAQVALGQVLFFSEWDWLGAERSFRRALEINPNHPEAYLHYGGLMEALGRLDRGLQLKQQALERDPTSPLTLNLIAVSFWNQRRYGDTITWVNKALDRDPTNLFARELRGGAYFKTGDIERMLEDGFARAHLLETPEVTLAAMKCAHAEIKEAYDAGGHQEAARCILKHAPQEAGRGSAALVLAVLHGEAGDLNTAFDHLDRAIDARDPGLVHLAVAPQWDCLRGAERFGERLQAMGLAAAADRAQRFLQQTTPPQAAT
jgi:DNA-binding winged helix-turn-helix (wHTH) protein